MTNPSKHDNTLLERLQSKINYSLDGLAYFTNDDNFVLTLVASVIFIVISLLFITRFEIKIIFVLFGVLIFCFEMINSVVENIVDRISLEKHELSKKIKDMSSCFQAVYIVSVSIALVLVVIYGKS